MISGVSFKRKLRDLVETIEGPVWQTLSSELAINTAQFQILESRGRNREEIDKKTGTEMQAEYWDARVFGSTYLKAEGVKKKESTTDFIQAGAIQFGNGVSIAPIRIERMTTTNKAGVEQDKDRGMAPLGYRVVEHGVYAMPFFLNPTAAVKSGCTQIDIELLKRLIPLAYSHSAAYGRPNVGMRHAWLIEHSSPLGSCSDFALLDALTPKKRSDQENPSISWDDYDDPVKLPDTLQQRVKPLIDLVMP